MTDHTAGSDDVDDLHLTDLVGDPADLPNLRGHIKTIRDELNEERDGDDRLDRKSVV